MRVGERIGLVMGFITVNRCYGSVQGRHEVNSEILCSFRERVSADEPVGNQTVGLQIVAQTQMG